MTPGPPRLAFVSAPGGSAFMAELLCVVATAVRDVGAEAIGHDGVVEDVLDERTVAVVVPHEYVAVAGPIAPEVARRVIGFGVEHPGTRTFESAAQVCAGLAASVHVADDAVREMRRRLGGRVERFVLGYSPVWDRRADVGVRDVDVTVLATADERRLGVLAESAADLAPLRTEVLLPPHEPMTRARPDFLLAEDKWRLLARSRLLLNVHREGSATFEWVRALEAISNGCVVLSEASSGLGPLVPGEHLLVASAPRLGRVAAAALRHPDDLARIAADAEQVCRELLAVDASATRLATLAGDVLRAAPRGGPWSRAPAALRPPELPPIAVWMPVLRALPDPAADADDRALAVLRDLAAPPGDGPIAPAATGRAAIGGPDIDLICVERPGDGPLARTLASVPASLPDVCLAVHVGRDGAPEVAPGSGRLARGCAWPDPIGRGRARHELLAQASAPWVLVLDSGDELLGDAVVRLWDEVRRDPTLDVVFPLAVLGSRTVVNAMIPELRRLERFAYLGRGYLVRRAFLDAIGGFATEVELGALVDHDFWRRAVVAGARVRHVRGFGVRLWEQSGPAPDGLVPRIAHRLLDRRAAIR